MPTKRFFVIIVLCLCFAAFAGRWAAAQSVPAATQKKAAESQEQTSGQSGYVLKVTTRLVTLDLIATDSHGNPVRDLKPEEVQIFEEHKAQQKIEQFEFLEKMRGGSPLNSASAVHKTPNVYSNQLPLDQLKIPPTVLLMDSLNTQTTNQMQGRAHMLELLKSLPADTPIAVFLLGSSLKILQGFTSDGALLRAALGQSVPGTTLAQNPRDDANSPENFILDSTGGMGNNLGLASQVGEMQDFEKEEYSMTFDLREKETLAALAQIGQYLSGIPGRKNLIWVSEAFPISIAPEPETGNNRFGGLRNYGDQVKNVANALTDAQVAVYPMDVRGLQAEQAFAASENVSSPRLANGPAISSRLNDEDTERTESQGTMDALAQDTGGRACKNRNDLSGCIMTALKDGSSYYEMSFYPENVKWDGRFHKILVKTSRPGVKLAYRRGYYALDAASLAKKQQPDEHLRQACTDLLPSTAIHLTVQTLVPSQPGASAGGLQYMLLISAAGLGTAQEGDSYNLNVRVAECEFAQKNYVFRFNERDLSKTVSGDVFRSWQSSGIPDHIALRPAADTRRIRLVVLDVSSGLAGAIDIPVLPSEIAKANAPVQPPVPIVTTPFLELPDKAKAPAPPKLTGSVTFHLGDQSGTLDWSGDTLIYTGEIPMEQAASGFSSYAFGGRFHCQQGNFVPVDPADVEPVLRFTFHNHNGKMVNVDLKGEQPLYLGDLSVDPGAKSLFDQVWKSSHCQAP